MQFYFKIVLQFHTNSTNFLVKLTYGLSVFTKGVPVLLDFV